MTLTARTCLTPVSDACETSQAFPARPRGALPEDGTGYDDAARLPARALCVQRRYSVVVTAEKSQVLIQAPAQLHAPVHGRADDDHLAIRAAGLEELGGTVVYRQTENTCTLFNHIIDFVK